MHKLFLGKARWEYSVCFSLLPFLTFPQPLKATEENPPGGAVDNTHKGPTLTPSTRTMRWWHHHRQNKMPAADAHFSLRKTTTATKSGGERERKEKFDSKIALQETDLCIQKRHLLSSASSIHDTLKVCHSLKKNICGYFPN